jgi:hypothetical protein
MEKHFLADMMAGEGLPEFHPEPWYNPDGDCIVYKMADEAVVADRVDELLTVYHSAVDNRPIGFQIKGVHAIIKKLGLDGLRVASESDAAGVKGISIAALLLAAYEEGEPTVARRKSYASAMDCPQMRTISADELAAA